MSRFENASAVVTGASQGLGLAVAQRLAQHGARLTICARDGEALSDAAWQLRNQGAIVHPVRCDVTDDGAAERIVAEAEHQFGGLDVLVNNVGVIRVGPLAALREADFREAMEAMYFAPLRLVLAALPLMRERGGGTIVNVTSLGGRIAAPHLLPYDGAKFALTGLSEGLRAELAGAGVSVTTVVPGLMRTGSHPGAQFRGDTAREYAWFAAAASLPLLSMDADRAARAVVRAAERRRSEIVLGAAARLAVRLHGLAPATTARAASVAARLLDQAADRGSDRDRSRTGTEAAQGADSRLLGILTTLGDRAARRLNQVR